MKKKPIAQLKAEGTYRPDRHADITLYAALENIPEPPTHFKKEKSLVELYTHYAGVLCSRQMLFPEDIGLLHRYCFAIYQAQEAEKAILKDGLTQTHKQDRGAKNEIENVHIKILNSAREAVNRLGAKLGFNLMDKSKIRIITEPKKANPINDALR